MSWAETYHIEAMIFSQTIRAVDTETYLASHSAGMPIFDAEDAIDETLDEEQAR